MPGEPQVYIRRGLSPERRATPTAETALLTNPRQLLPAVAGVLCLVAVVVAHVLGAAGVAVALAALYGTIVLVLVVHLQARMGVNYRQMREAQGSLSRQLQDVHRSDTELRELAERMTPTITRTVARDWSVNASRIAARYEVLEQEVRALIDELEQRADAVDERGRSQAADLEAAVSAMQTSLADQLGRLSRDSGHISRLPTSADVRRGLDDSVSEVDALLQLRRWFPDGGRFPMLGGWALSPRAMLHTLDLIEESAADLVVECGSGASTVYIAQLLQHRGRGRVVSLEHDHAYLTATRGALERLGLLGRVELRHAPLADVEVGAQTYAWYAPEALHGIEGIDVLLVDGPPTATGEMARYPALPTLAHRLAERAVVLVDDATRTDEKATVRRWCEEYGLIRDYSPTRDLAVLRRDDGAAGGGAL